MQLLVFPELHLSALPAQLEDGRGHAERVAVEIPGELTERLEAIAAEAGVWLVAGSVYERGRGDAIHNTALAVSPQRGLVAAYRKAFPWQPSERTEPGDRFVVFDIDGVGRAGLAICYDGFFPEVFRQLAWMGAEVVFQPTLTTTSDRGAELVTARANAIVNQLYVVNVNAAAPAGLGRSLIVDPEGMVKVEAGSTDELLDRRSGPRRGHPRARVRNRRRLAHVAADRQRRRVGGGAADVRGRSDQAPPPLSCAAARRPLRMAPSIRALYGPAVCSPANASGPVGSASAAATGGGGETE